MKNIFGKEKIVYKNIEIPEKLEFIVIKSINECKQKSNYNIRLLSKIIIASVIIFFIAINIFPRLSKSLQNLPIVGKIVEFLTLDKDLEIKN